MPNWCWNKVKISGPADEVRKLAELVRTNESAFSFNKVIPMPEELAGIHCGFSTTHDGKKVRNWRVVDRKTVAVNEKALVKKCGFVNWYDWAYANWGTKWDASDTETVCHNRKGHGTATISFTTAWGPPEPVLARLAELFPSLKIKLNWNEEGGQKGSSEF